jgi:hypothetical protein
MKFLKMLALGVLAIWAAWTTLELKRLDALTAATCAVVYADIEAWNMKAERPAPAHPSRCGWVDLKRGP